MSHKGNKASNNNEKWERLNDLYGAPRPKTARAKTAKPRAKTSHKTETPHRAETPPDIVESVPIENPVPIEEEFEFIPFPIPTPKQTISNLRIGETITELKMVPNWFEQEDQQEALKNIVYPPNVTNHRPFNSVARYRAAFRNTNNFLKKPIKSNRDTTETLIVGLDTFAQQLGGDLSFTNKDISFNDVSYRTACGIANLASVHLLATNHISTARFIFHTKLSYKKDLAKSDDTMQNFILSFSTAIAERLNCNNDYVRVLSVEKDDDDNGNANVDFGITTPEQIQTEILAKDLEEYMRSDFQDNCVLNHIKKGQYPCRWMPLITYLDLRAKDFVTEHNYGYTVSDIRPNCRRGGYPYNIPIGWYRHALNISKKYPGDDIWLGCKNIPGEWPVAYHGTHAEAVSNITRDGLSIDKIERDDMRQEAVERMGSKFDAPGFYLSTYCTGGAHPTYTKTFSVYISEKKTERFRIVFQCRVKPGEFTVHKSPSTPSQTWRVVNPTAVRPYGILVRKRKIPKYDGDQSESDEELFT